MNGKKVSNLAVAAALAGGLLTGSAGWAAAQDHDADDGAHQHESGTPVAASQSEAPDDAMTSMMRDMMEEMMPGMMDGMMPGMMDGMHAEMMERMMACMMGDMRDGTQGGGMMGGMVDHQKSDRDGYWAMAGMTDEQHARMQAVVADALGLTVDELESEIADGKSVPQIAEEQGVDLADLHEAVMGEFDRSAR
jgi:hypothetical protein